MNEKPQAAIVLDPERYELSAEPLYHFDVDRREFFKLLGAGVLVYSALNRAVTQESGGAGHSWGDSLPKEIDTWLHMGENGRVIVYTGKVEVGQNIRTSLSQAVAEELHIAIDKIEMVMGDTQLTPFDMGTFGSRTTPTMNLQLRKVAAAARDLLVGLAAAQWQADRTRLVAADGRVGDPQTKRSVEYAALVKGQQLAASIPFDDPLVSATDWKIAGQSVHKVNGRDFVTGRHRYTSDIRRDGMLHAKIVRPPAYGAALARVETSGAERISGVTVVHDGNFLGVAAPSAAAAADAAAAITAEWAAGSGASARTLFADLKAKVEDNNQPPFVAGSVDAALARADVKVEGEYTVAYIAHAPLEPRAAVAEWRDGKLTVWTGTQRPFGVQQELVDAFHLPADRVRVVVPDTGSAYGGKHTGDAAIEAARLARAAGKPVKLVWTREEEFAWAYFRPAGVIDVRAAAQKDGTITAWDFHNYNSGPAGIRTPYDIANQRIAFHPSQYPLRQGSYRGLAATANHFARESHMDDLAHATGIDPLALRLKNLRDERLIAVLKGAADKFGWRAGSRGIGLACGVEKGGYTAKSEAMTVKLKRVVVAFECGAIVNPDGLNNQVEGAIVQGLGGALFEAIDFEDGKLANGRFAQYRLPRFSDVPPIDVVLIDRRDIAPAGAGETPIVGIAPAIGNAIFNATGVRLRALPLIPNGIPSPTNQQ